MDDGNRTYDYLQLILATIYTGINQIRATTRRGMRPRQILGLAMIFLFLPTNSGLYLSILEGATPADKVPGGFVMWLCGLFLIGILLVLVPSREQAQLSIGESE